MPIAEGDIVSAAAEGKCEAGLSFKLGLNTYSGAPSTSKYENNASGNTITPTDSTGGTMWHWSRISKYTIPDSTADTTFMRLQFTTLATSTGVQDLDAYFRQIMVTVDSEKNEKVIWKWGASPVGEFIPQYIGQQYLDTSTSKFYSGFGFTSTSWVAL
jgi:hypothetical protein